MKKPPTAAQLTKQVREWNETVPPGSLVKYFAVIGERWHYEIFRTSGQAYILSGHTAVVHLDKKSGCVALDACELYDRAVPKLYAVNAKEQLRRWDSGDSIWTIEMGGLGPGYEQAIQLAAIELLRDEIGKPLPEQGDPEANRKWGQSTIERIDKPGNHMGLSGAQWGAARFLAYKWITIGPKALMDDPAYKDRHIQASQVWPHIAK